MALHITKYVAAWHAKDNKGVIRFFLKNGTKTHWRGTDAAEFTAFVAILEAADRPYLTAKGWISTGPEEPG